MSKSLLLIIACLLFPMASYAIEPMPTNSQGNLYVSVFIIDSPEFSKEWINTPASHSPSINTIDEVSYNQMVHAGFAITGFSKGKDSRVNFVVAIQVENPDGKIILQENEWSVHTKKVVQDKGIIMAASLLDMTFPRSVPSGSYKISAIVTDKISGKSASGSAMLSLH